MKRVRSKEFQELIGAGWSIEMATRKVASLRASRWYMQHRVLRGRHYNGPRDSHGRFAKRNGESMSKRAALAIVVLLFLGGTAQAQITPPTIEKSVYETSLTPKQIAILNLVSFPAQVTNPCGTASHCTILTWAASPSQTSCLSTGTPACAWSYEILRGTTSGAEATTPINGSTVIIALTYIDPITLTSAPQTYFYEVEAQETVTEANGTVVADSGPSNEASASFPGQPGAVSTTTATAH